MTRRGPPYKISEEQVKEAMLIKATGKSIAWAAIKLKVSVVTLYKAIRRYKSKEE
jgi:transposase